MSDGRLYEQLLDNSVNRQVEEVYRFSFKEYKDKDYPELDEIVTKKGLTYDINGELGDFFCLRILEI